MASACYQTAGAMSDSVPHLEQRLLANGEKHSLQRAPCADRPTIPGTIRIVRHGSAHAWRALRNAFFSPGRRLLGLGFSLDYPRFAWRASRQMDYTGPGSLDVAGFRVDYLNQ